MKYLKKYETFTNKATIGIDIDGTIGNFVDAYNLTYKKYFPDKEPLSGDDWHWYKQMDYNGEFPKTWFNNKKSEIFDLEKTYDDAVNTVNNIYDFIKTYGFSLKIVTKQPTEEAKQAAKNWIDKLGFKYDEIAYADSSKDKWKYADIMVDDSVKVLETKPLSKVSIKVEHPYNLETYADINIPNIKGLTINVVREAISKLKNTATL